MPGEFLLSPLRRHRHACSPLSSGFGSLNPEQITAANSCSSSTARQVRWAWCEKVVEVYWENGTLDILNLLNLRSWRKYPCCWDSAKRGLLLRSILNIPAKTTKKLTLQATDWSDLTSIGNVKLQLENIWGRDVSCSSCQNTSGHEKSQTWYPFSACRQSGTSACKPKAMRI